ncbi:MAG: NusG domain II-containing protein [Clostridia bacterium]|nr:NusG domain II-containing protein [Clostridia bacterium]
MNQKVRIWDFLLIAALVAACACVWLIPRETGASATVSVDGEIVAVLPLSQEGEFLLPMGGRVVVRDGKVSLCDAVCEDKLCENMGEISGEGQTILCLPLRVSVVISGEVDAYVG